MEQKQNCIDLIEKILRKVRSLLKLNFGFIPSFMKSYEIQLNFAPKNSKNFYVNRQKTTFFSKKNEKIADSITYCVEFPNNFTSNLNTTVANILKCCGETLPFQAGA